MNEIDSIREILRDFEAPSASEAYEHEVMRDKLQKEIRKHISDVIKAVDNDSFTPLEVLNIASVTPDYVSLSGNEDIIRALRSWIDRNRERENTTEVRLYTEEAERMLTSLCI